MSQQGMYTNEGRLFNGGDVYMYVDSKLIIDCIITRIIAKLFSALHWLNHSISPSNFSLWLNVLFLSPQAVVWVPIEEEMIDLKGFILGVIHFSNITGAFVPLAI